MLGHQMNQSAVDVVSHSGPLNQRRRSQFSPLINLDSVLAGWLSVYRRTRVPLEDSSELIVVSERVLCEPEVCRVQPA